ncbi:MULTISPECIES: tryptophan synthase subunit alpha [Photobacterium]|uniref:Tryptophan synthase alpha chain n=1 Tax=Photobacterium ganghwense TaxID=320778 RepID=A0A0J1HID1_9GAMM|nr:MULTISPECIES: tryptophan synthase subunit alpha [Photobacterium]KLV11355.1 tryptophan synthase subunit alpha [Photobacterium ganghwense]PSU08207.1 tryptophan synthase subunit alpha [Photobacterium ganghwense]QSV15015.1 tryptophan synthase subunit alpha [Photobacterium ganghwense]
MDRYQTQFARLAAKQEGAFVPFVTIGDPNPEQSLNIIETLIAAGADALELGIPFSDPLADGPTIQGSTIRALESGTTPTVCFELLKTIRERHPDIPVGLLMYANLVFANGIEHFYQRCADAGVDSVLVADVPVKESAEFRAAAEKYGIHPIFIAPPNANEDTLKTVAEYGGGYTYLLSRAGVTGAETKAGMPIDNLLASLKAHDAPPALLGFGISEPAQVKDAIQAGAAGAISGSAVVKIIERNLADNDAMLSELHRFVSDMKAATRV